MEGSFLFTQFNRRHDDDIKIKHLGFTRFISIRMRKNMVKTTEGFWALGLHPTIKLQQQYNQDNTIQIAIIIRPN